MSKLTLLVLCAQTLLIQNAYGQAVLQQINQGYGYEGIVSSGCGNNLVQSVVSSPVFSQVQVGNNGLSGNIGGFGGDGVGQLGIAGKLPIGGSTYVEGNLPVVGVVEFNGALPALGFVTVAGSTPCQCGGYSVY